MILTTKYDKLLGILNDRLEVKFQFFTRIPCCSIRSRRHSIAISKSQIRHQIPQDQHNISTSPVDLVSFNNNVLLLARLRLLTVARSGVGVRVRRRTLGVAVRGRLSPRSKATRRHVLASLRLWKSTIPVSILCFSLRTRTSTRVKVHLPERTGCEKHRTWSCWKT